jgi:hypothetical protein
MKKLQKSTDISFLIKFKEKNANFQNKRKLFRT